MAGLFRARRPGAVVNIGTRSIVIHPPTPPPRRPRYARHVRSDSTLKRQICLLIFAPPAGRPTYYQNCSTPKMDLAKPQQIKMTFGPRLGAAFRSGAIFRKT
jgi:hypothetical protein